MGMWIAKRLDVTWGDLLYGLVGCAMPYSRAARARLVEATWSERDQCIACLSVRSGFDLLFGAAEFPTGDEVIFSALTIADMPRIVDHHGLIPVPVDIDVESATPRLEKLKQSITRKTRAIVVTHLYGGRMDLDPIVDLARDGGLLLIEDCAQAYAGRGYDGHPRSDVTMFSFGPIKTATALGGGLLRVRDESLRNRMRALQGDYPVQSRAAYAVRLLKYTALHAISGPLTYAAALRSLRLLGVDHDAMMNRLTRGFTGKSFFDGIRKQPCGALLRLLYRRLRQDGGKLARRSADGRALQERLGPSVVCPGGRLAPHYFWVFPVLAERPSELIAALRRAGFDATKGRSLDAVGGSDAAPDEDIETAKDVLARTVFLPFYPEITASGWARMAEVVRADR